MIEAIDPKNTEKPLARCAECDREREHYNILLSPSNEQKVVCWECMEREQKGLFAKRTFRRGARNGFIPR